MKSHIALYSYLSTVGSKLNFNQFQKVRKSMFVALCNINKLIFKQSLFYFRDTTTQLA